MPRADDVPFFHFETRNVPSTTNALGMKGAGEAGTIGATPAALNAVTDALYRAYGIGHIDMPATPSRIWEAIQDAAGPATRPGQLIIQHSPLTGIALKSCRSRSSSACLPSSRRQGSFPPARSSSSAPSSPSFPSWSSSHTSANCAPLSSPTRPLNHIARGVVGVSSMVLGFFALTRLPLPEAITLNYAQPLLVVVFSALFLGETDPFLPLERGHRRPARCLHHFLAEAYASVQPGGDGNQEAVGVAAALGAAGISAVALLLVRNLVRTEKTATIVLWFSLTASVRGLIDPSVRLAGARSRAGCVPHQPRVFAAASRRS